MMRLAGRCLILLLAAYFYFSNQTEQFAALEKQRFFEKLSLLHLLWGVWMIDMLCQLIPAKKNLALGSLKVFKQYFVPSTLKNSATRLRQYIVTTGKMASKIILLWTALIVAIGVVYWKGFLGDRELLMISILFYVCDLVCVLVWCPFRLLLKNRCCTTCRIFNWDHLMMFTPMVYVGSFFSVSLLLVSFTVWLAWELGIVLHPERFWWGSNAALSCEHCTDKLCTQYCQKLKKKH